MSKMVEELRAAQRARGQATVLAIGTANPPNVFYQADYPDFYFKVTKSEHMTKLKEKFKRICESLTLICYIYQANDMFYGVFFIIPLYEIEN